MKCGKLGALLLGVSSLYAEERMGTDEFRNYEMGTSRHNYSFELNYGGGLANSVFYPSIAYNRIFFGGAGEVNIPFTYFFNTANPEKLKDDATPGEFVDPYHKLIGSGLKLRYFTQNTDEGLFFGGGVRINYWDINYTWLKVSGSRPKVNEQSWNVIPLFESGYNYPIEQIRNFSVQASGELGWNLVQDTYDLAGDRGILPFAETKYYWTVTAGVVYAF